MRWSPTRSRRRPAPVPFYPQARRGRRGSTVVEFALVAPFFFAVVLGIFSAATYVFEVQVANQAAQAAARWGVAAANWTGSPNAQPQCPAATPPAAMLASARAAAGPFAASITASSLTAAAAPPPSSTGLGTATYGCQIQVTLPYVSFAGPFGLGPRTITATAVDYVT